MRKRSIFKTVSALAMAAIMTVGVSATAFAAELSVSLDFKAPDGSAVETTTVEGKTVYLLPPNSTVSVASTNASSLMNTISVSFSNVQEVGNIKIRSMGWEPSDLRTDTVYNVDTELLSYPLIVANPYKQYSGYEAPWVSDWGYMDNDGQIDINNLPEYPYFEMSIFDPMSDNTNADSIYYYFKFAKDAATTPVATSSWASDANGWWIQNSDGTYLTNTWYQSNGQWYYMGADGYMLTNTTTPDGYPVNADGVWVQ